MIHDVREQDYGESGLILRRAEAHSDQEASS
jgi:hypothetical protein